MSVAESIYQVLRTKIMGGELQAGSSLPSEQELCQEHRVARGTIRTALARLAEEGYVQGTRGTRRTVRNARPLERPTLRIFPSSETLTVVPLQKVGGLTSPGFGSYLHDSGCNPRDEKIVLPAKLRCADVTHLPRLFGEDAAKRLRIQSNDLVIWFLRLRWANDEPVALQWVVVPAAIVPEVSAADLCPGGVTRLYHETYHIHRERCEAQYRPTRATREEAAHLRLERAAPLIEERRVSFCAPPREKEPVPYEYLISLYTDRLSLDFHWVEQPATTAAPARVHPAKRRQVPKSFSKVGACS